MSVCDFNSEEKRTSKEVRVVPTADTGPVLEKSKEPRITIRGL
jgi:hypothetical protein